MRETGTLKYGEIKEMTVKSPQTSSSLLLAHLSSVVKIGLQEIIGRISKNYTGRQGAERSDDIV